VVVCGACIAELRGSVGLGAHKQYVDRLPPVQIGRPKASLPPLKSLSGQRVTAQAWPPYARRLRLCASQRVLRFTTASALRRLYVRGDWPMTVLTRTLASQSMVVEHANCV
jgi:hypothetical protein